MIILARSEYLLLLLLIPFLFIGVALWMRARRRRVRAIGDEELVKRSSELSRYSEDAESATEADVIKVPGNNS